jgi:hypothetical protein
VNIIVLDSHLCCTPVNLTVVSTLRTDLQPVAAVPLSPAIKGPWFDDRYLNSDIFIERPAPQYALLW